MGSDSLNKGYEPKGIEEKWYTYWLDNGFFKAEDKSDKEAFSIVSRNTAGSGNRGSIATRGGAILPAVGRPSGHGEILKV